MAKAISLSLSDVLTHVVKFGIDIYPPISYREEQTRLNIFYDEMRSIQPQLFQKVHASAQEFKVFADFRAPNDEAKRVTVSTFDLTSRGPVFVYPLKCPPPIGDTAIADDYLELFTQARSMFFRAIPGRQSLRLGLIREVVFGTGDEAVNTFFARQAALANAVLTGGKSVRVYQDDRHNHRIVIDSVEIARETRLAVGTTVSEPTEHGLQITLDVNNEAIRPLEEADIQQVIERANSLWPDELLSYLSREGGPE